MSCSILRPMRELTCLHRGYRRTSLGGHMPCGPQSESPVPAKCWRVALWRVIQRPPKGLECAWLRLQQAWVCLSCFSEVEANVLNGFECLRKFSFFVFCFSTEQLFRHRLKISLGELKAETSLTLNVIWLKKKKKSHFGANEKWLAYFRQRTASGGLGPLGSRVWERSQPQTGWLLALEPGTPSPNHRRGSCLSLALRKILGGKRKPLFNTE